LGSLGTSGIFFWKETHQKNTVYAQFEILPMVCQFFGGQTPRWLPNIDLPRVQHMPKKGGKAKSAKCREAHQKSVEFPLTPEEL
jgi:hypothetical protein